MIFAYVGGVGSGKTASLVKSIVQRKNRAYTNFAVKGATIERLKKSDIVKKLPAKQNAKGEITKYQYKVNYEFWQKKVKAKVKFDIYIDEIHNIIHARQAMSKFNVEATKWVAQIRKLMGQHKNNHLYIISQRPMGIDIAFRELAHAFILCKAHDTGLKKPTKTLQGTKILPITVITQYIFRNIQQLEMFMLNPRLKGYAQKKAFVANNYYQYYDTYEVVDFDDEYL